MPDRRPPAAYAVLVALVLAGCSAAPSGAPVSPSPAPSTAASSAPSPSPSTVSPAASSSATSPSATATTSSVPSVGPTAGTGPDATAASVYGHHVTLTDTRLRWDQLRWYTGKAAHDRCKQLKRRGEGAWCNEYFYEETTRKGTGAITQDTVVQLLDDDGQLQPSSSAQLPPAIRRDDWPYFRIWRSGDTINRIEQVFTP